jgi:hypothetical protein
MTGRMALAVLLALGVSVAVGGCGNTLTGLFGGDQNTAERTTGFIAASAFNASAETTTAGILVRWELPSAPLPDPAPRGSYIVGYELYRATRPNFEATASNLVTFVVGGRTTEYVDDNSVRDIQRTITVTAQDTGVVQVTSVDEQVDPTSTTGNSITAATDEREYVIQSLGVQSGQTYYYAVVMVIKKLAPIPFDPTSGGGSSGGGSTTDAADITGQLTAGSTPVYTGAATALERPELASPADYPSPGSQDVDITTVQFQWYTVPGANSYAIEASTDRDFPADQTIKTDEILINNMTGGQQVARSFVGGGFADNYEGYDGIIYWRVGAKRDTDALEPINIQTGLSAGWVFSEPRGFQPQTAPPLPPGS